VSLLVDPCVVKNPADDTSELVSPIVVVEVPVSLSLTPLVELAESVPSLVLELELASVAERAAVITAARGQQRKRGQEGEQCGNARHGHKNSEARIIAPTPSLGVPAPLRAP
jgi:hypothetical protein